MKYEFATEGIELKSQEAKAQMDMINMKLNGIYNIVVKKRVLKIQCVAIYGQTRKIKILEVGEPVREWVEDR